MREVQRNPDSMGEKVIVKSFVKQLMFSGTFEVQRIVRLVSIRYEDPRLDSGQENLVIRNWNRWVRESVPPAGMDTQEFEMVQIELREVVERSVRQSYYHS